MTRKGHIDALLTATLPRSREGWGYENVRHPRKPCPTVGAQLQAMYPGDERVVNGVRVKRGNNSKSKWYFIGGQQMSYADAVSALAAMSEGVAA